MMKKSKTRQKLFSANSEIRKGFTMPTVKKIKSVLMSRSKTFLVNLILSMMVGMSKTAKIKVLIKIEKGTMIKRKGKKRTAKRKVVKRMSTKRKATKTRGKGFQGKKKGSKAEKMAIAKAQRARKRR